MVGCDLPNHLQRAGGAVVRAEVAVLAYRRGARLLEFGLDDRLEAAPHEAQQPLLRLFGAHANAEVAEHALALVALDRDELLLNEAGVLVAAQSLAIRLQQVRVAE